MGIAILDIGHRGYLGPSMGARSAGYVEGELSPMYAVHTYLALIERGHLVYLPSRAMGYQARAARAHEIARENPGEKVAFVQFHLNKSEGHDYSLTCWLQSRPNDRGLAAAISTELGYRPIERASCLPVYASSTWLNRPYSCLAYHEKGAPNLAAVLVEACFLDNPAHQAQLLTVAGLVRLGLAVADGINSWLLSN